MADIPAATRPCHKDYPNTVSSPAAGAVPRSQVAWHSHGYLSLAHKMNLVYFRTNTGSGCAASTGGSPEARSDHMAGTAPLQLVQSGKHGTAVVISAWLPMDFVFSVAFSQPCCRQKDKSSCSSSFYFLGTPHEGKGRGGTGSQRNSPSASRDHVSSSGRHSDSSMAEPG